MLKKLKIVIIVIAIILVGTIFVILFNRDESEIKNIKSSEELLKIYEGKELTAQNLFLNIVTMPFSFITGGVGNYAGGVLSPEIESFGGTSITDVIKKVNPQTYSSSSNSKDYSTTNIQVENVDEADITKTDGDYIYSISENNVVITNVINPDKIEIASKIRSTDGSIPEDLILYKNELVVISSLTTNSSSFYNYRDSSNNTVVKIYDISNKTNPSLLKKYELYEPYYTSRCIDNQLYVISSGYLREENDEVLTIYEEDSTTRQISFDNIKYLKDIQTSKQTLISTIDLDNAKNDVKVSSFLIDISNAYVSEKAIYLLDEKYSYNNVDVPPISSLFGLKGALGPFEYEQENKQENSYGYYTQIYKFDISKDGNVTYNTKTKIKGSTINQYSLDENEGHLRVALYDTDGARIAIFNEKLENIGTSEYVAKGERMYSSRFMNNKVYLVTYKTTDPLFVIDLSNEEKPKVLGKLEIPGYSTYLHPYDDNHIIGIGMETEEVVNRNSSGKVISTTSNIIGMKMALFDVSDVSNPIQISNTVIGDRRTTSAILTNPKALLFSKEKSLIAIPVNNYAEDFSVKYSNDDYTTINSAYTNYKNSYIAEGYFVYNIDIDNGFKLKGVVTHENDKNVSINYGYYGNSKLLRGLYIDNNLYTVSETMVKVNDLENLELISELKIK